MVQPSAFLIPNSIMTPSPSQSKVPVLVQPRQYDEPKYDAIDLHILAVVRDFAQARPKTVSSLCSSIS